MRAFVSADARRGGVGAVGVRQWAANVLNDDNVFNEIPEDRYPFNPTANGHEWKKWDEGDTASEAIKEMNVFDHGQGLAAINLGEHAITDEDGMGIPFKCRDAESEDGANPCPEKNVFDSIVDPEVSQVRARPRVCAQVYAHVPFAHGRGYASERERERAIVASTGAWLTADPATCSSPSTPRRAATSGGRLSRRLTKTRTCLIRRSSRTTSTPDVAYFFIILFFLLQSV